MKTTQILELLKQKSITIPLFLYREKDELNLSDDTFFFLMYLMNQKEKTRFNPEEIKQELNCSLENIMKWVSTLTEKGYISLEVEKNDSGVMEEYISLEMFYHKLLKKVIDKMSDEEEKKDSSIYDKIQQEFGRVLSPMEYEIIGAWIESNISEELIYEALKEAVFNGVNNLRYIDKILYEWGKKGYKNKQDVEKNRQIRNQEKKPVKGPKKEIFDYNWLEEDDE